MHLPSSRLLGPGLAVALVAVGFGGGITAGLLERSTARARTVTMTRVEVVNGDRHAEKRAVPLPTLLEGATDPRDLALSSAVPNDADVLTANYILQPPRQLIVTWSREGPVRDGGAAVWQRSGLAVWQLDRGGAASWHRVYTRETSPLSGIEAYHVSLGDASGDGRPEILVFFDTDGSAGGGIYHLFANDGYRVRQVFVKDLSNDEGTASFAHHALVVLRGLDYRGPGIHCCYRKVRETWLRWDGRNIIVLRQVVRKNRRIWPPG